MQEVLNQFLGLARGMWRFRVPALLVAWVVCLIGWVIVLVLPPEYRASARVYVDTSAVLRPLLEGIAVEQDISAQLNFVRQVMVSRPQLEKVARDTDLDLQAQTPQEKEDLIASLGERIQISSAGETGSRRTRAAGGASNLYEISFEDPRRQQALKVVQVIVNNFVEDTLGGKRSGADAAQRFLRAQIDEYEQRLRTAEEQLAEFKRSNVGLVPGASGGDYFSRLQAEIQNLERTQAALRVAIQRRDELQRQLRGERPSPSSGGGSSRPSAAGAEAAAGGDLSLRVAETERQLDALLLRYTEKHPEVVATRQILAELQQRQQAEIEALQKGQASVQTMAGLSASPVYQQIQTQLNQANVEVVSLQSQAALSQQQVNRLQAMLNSAPEVEAEFARLNRDYDVTRAQYNELLSRLERAKISEDAEQTGVIRFDVIDPPNVGLEPVTPDRPRLLLLVLAAGLGAGLLLAFVLHQLKPVFTDTRALGEITGLPVIGAISRTWRERHKAERRREALRVSAAAACLVGVFVIVLLVHEQAVRVIQGLIG